jgi:ParD-like antitoxin of type II bacterial toxin-antitoxin system
MGQSVRLSDEIVADARLKSDIFQRTIGGQVEFWARLGQSTESLLNGQNLRTLLQNNSAGPPSDTVDNVERAEGHERPVDS